MFGLKVPTMLSERNAPASAERKPLGVVSWVLAIALGIPAAYGFVLLISNVLVTVPFAFNPVALVWMLAFVVAVASAATLGPVWAASHIKIAQTLRYE